MIQSPSGDADQSWEGGIFPHPLKGTLSKTGRVYPGFGVRILGCLFLAVHYWESYSASLNVIVITCDQGLIKALHRGLWEGLTTSAAFMITVIQALCSRGTRGRIPALTELPSESSCLYTDSPCSPHRKRSPGPPHKLHSGSLAGCGCSSEAGVVPTRPGSHPSTAVTCHFIITSGC